MPSTSVNPRGKPRAIMGDVALVSWAGQSRGALTGFLCAKQASPENGAGTRISFHRIFTFRSLVCYVFNARIDGADLEER
jgi:hypothetical protein